MSNHLDELKKLADLKNQGILTEDEFQKEKEKLLNQNSVSVQTQNQENQKANGLPTKTQKCFKCKKEFDAKEKICPVCGKKQPSTAAGCFLIIAFFIIIICILFAIFGDHSGKSNSTASAQTNSVTTISANELDIEYGKNEISAENKYKGKLIIVTGKVTEISTAFDGTPYVSIASDIYGMAYVKCYFEDKNSITSINTDDKVKIEGVVSNYTYGHPTLEQCSFVD